MKFASLIIPFLCSLAVPVAYGQLSFENRKGPCITKNFNNVYLDFLGTRGMRLSYQGTYVIFPTCKDAKHVDELYSRISNDFSEFHLSKTDLFLSSRFGEPSADGIGLHLPNESDKTGILTDPQIAHEIGHLLFHSQIEPLVISDEERTIQLRGAYYSQLECGQLSHDDISDIISKDDATSGIRFSRELLTFATPSSKRQERKDAKSVEIEQQKKFIIDSLDELFADTVAVIICSDPAIIAKSLPKRNRFDQFASRRRDFSLDVNQFEVFNFNNQLNFFSHLALAPARHKLFEKSFSKGNYSPVVLYELMAAIKSTLKRVGYYHRSAKIHTLFEDLNGVPAAAENLKRFNQILIQEIDSNGKTGGDPVL